MGIKQIVGKDYFLKLIPSPAIVLSTDLASWIAYAIRAKSKGGWSHAMLHIGNGVLASQEWKMRTRTIQEYIEKFKETRLQAIWNPDWNEHQKFAIIRKAQEDIANRGSYDVLGIIGQLFGVRWMNFGNWEYCSEQVINCIKSGDLSPIWISTIEKIKDISPEFDEEHYNPQEIDIMGEVLNWNSMIYDPTL